MMGFSMDGRPMDFFSGEIHPSQPGNRTAGTPSSLGHSEGQNGWFVLSLFDFRIKSKLEQLSLLYLWQYFFPANLSDAHRVHRILKSATWKHASCGLKQRYHWDGHVFLIVLASSRSWLLFCHVLCAVFCLTKWNLWILRIFKVLMFLGNVVGLTKRHLFRVKPSKVQTPIEAEEARQMLERWKDASCWTQLSATIYTKIQQLVVLLT